MKKQKLSAKLKNTPRNTSLVPCSVNSGLNRDQSLSDQNKVLTDNNPEVNLHQHTGGLKDVVYVISKEGKALMPCSRAKARHLLEAGRARVIGKYPFRIQLNFSCENQVQDVTLGVDLGYGNIGFSAVTDKSELISGVMKLDNRMSERILKKKMYRQNRRTRLWYRESRFNNRSKARAEGWLAPSIKRRISVHINLVKRIQSLLQISKINLELANFDIQKINNPNIESIEYQQGNLCGYENVKAFLIARECGLCQLCKKEYDNNGWHTHHIIPRGKNGTNRSDNLALLHKKCHDKLHKQKLFDKLQKSKQFKAETFMSISKYKILEEIKAIHNNVTITYGYETKLKRIENNLEKSHSNDAFIIANGTNQNRNIAYILNQKKHNNRCLQCNRKGYKPSIRRKRYSIQPRDLFWINGKQYVSRGMYGYGKCIWYSGINRKESISIQKIEKYFNINSWQFI